MNRAEQMVLWDAIKAEWFGGTDDVNLADVHRRWIGRLVRDFAACEGGDATRAAEKLPKIANMYRGRHPTWECTAESVLKRWHEFSDGVSVSARRTTERIAVQNRLDAELLASCPPEVVAEARQAAWSPTVDAAAAEVIREWKRNGKLTAAKPQE